VLCWGWLTGLDRDNDHFVRRPVHCVMSSFYRCMIINSQVPSQRQRTLVDLVVFLSHDPFHECESVLDIRIERRLLPPFFYILISLMNGRASKGGAAKILSFIERTWPEFIHKCRLIFGSTASGTKEWWLIDRFEEFLISGMSWVVRAFGNLLAKRRLLLCFWRALILRGWQPSLALIVVHHLIVSLEPTGGSHGTLKICRGIFVWRIRSPAHLCHRVIVSHADLAIILVVFPIIHAWDLCLLTLNRLSGWTLSGRRGSRGRDGECSSWWNGNLATF
jgi:hypothetical protein